MQDVEGREGRVGWAGILELDTESSAVDAGGGDCGFTSGGEGGVYLGLVTSLGVMGEYSWVQDVEGRGGGEIELVYWSWILRAPVDARGGNVDSLLGGRVVCNSLTEESPGFGGDG